MMAKLTPQMSPKHTARTTVAQPDSKHSPSGSNTSSPKLERVSPKSSPKSSPSSPSEPAEKSDPVSPPPTEVLATPTFHLLPVLGVLVAHMRDTHHETKMETLRWIMWLEQHIPKRVNLLLCYYSKY